MARKTEPASEPKNETMPQTGGSFIRQPDGSLVEAEPPTVGGARSMKVVQPDAEVNDGTA